jgi:hypothetical protein
MTLTLTPVDDVVLITPPAMKTLTLVPPLSVVPLTVPTGDPISIEPQDASLGLLVPVPGPPGPIGDFVFDYLMPVAQTTAVIDHTLGRDPVVVQVIDPSTQAEVDEYGVVFLIPGERVRVSFDISIQALIRLK